MSIAAVKGAQPATPAHEGLVEATTVPQLFHILWQRRATGVLTLSDRDISRSAVIEQGRVQFASSTDRDDRFNHVLLLAGVISLNDLMRVLEAALASRDRLGEVMVRWNLISAADVEKWVKVQVRRILIQMFDTTVGRFSFEERPVEIDAYALNLNGDAMVLEGVRKVRSWARVYKEVGGLNTEYLTTREMPAITAGLPLAPEEWQLLHLCSESTSLGEMCEASSLLDLQVCKTVWAFLIVGALMKA
jgi:hypothetical protein